MAKTILSGFSIIGLDLLKLLNSMRGFVPYLSDYSKIKAQLTEMENDFPLARSFPCLTDRYETNGELEKHYFHQDLFVAQRILQGSPNRHIDIGSRVDGFVAHVAVSRKIEVLDIRPMPFSADNIEFLQCDLMNRIPSSLTECCDSLSCLHALEHFGLGRYGDPIDVNGHLVGFKNLSSMLTSGGTLYISVPIGEQRIEFNAHRVFSIHYLLNMFDDNFSLKQFSYINDEGNLLKEVALSDEIIQRNAGCWYGCGIFELTKN